MAVMLEALERVSRRDELMLHRNESNRLNLLVVHAVAAMLISPLFALVTEKQMAASSWAALRHVPFMPLSMSLLLGVGGVILLPSTLLRRKNWESVGLWFISGWYLMMGFGFFAASVMWAFNGGKGIAPSFYAVTVYLHLAIIMNIHLYTLRKLRRRRQAVVAAAAGAAPGE